MTAVRVRREPPPLEGHRCPVWFCDCPIASSLAMCPAHWSLLPNTLRGAINRAREARDWRRYASALEAAVRIVNAKEANQRRLAERQV